MALEIERKFLVDNKMWLGAVEKRISIVQFYVAIAADRSIRVRIKDGKEARFTLKFGSDLPVRDEYEFPIPLQEAQEMMEFAIGTIIRKTRHHVRHKDYLYEIDVFSGELDGLVMTELETPDAVSQDMLPDWLGREVTGQQAYSNASLALNGYPEPVLS
ncbi:CYTH domain-containing protein [Mesorhizobium sp. BE184]|uniref:CYTH domain-containing protein n=1 Tax=Mesorhizobium sp. BE184 TaxID=2817714 RepID=UPI002864C308|nr:CYTH domain-containing protein [Mesorhizobium sp. BE184]MDR7031492.1 CYTH domain-containing protein [Mesorhizobium sp. BE184]